MQKKPNEKRGVLSGVLELIYRQETYPFEQFSQKSNPFYDERRVTFQKLIVSLSEFGDECADFSLWLFGEKSLIDNKIIEMEKRAKNIYSTLKSLIPYESKKIRKHAIIRIFERGPENLVKLVVWLKLEMELYDQKNKNKIKGASRTSKRLTINEFYKKRFKSDIPRKIKIDDRAAYTIALSIIAYVEKCSYTKLKDIYESVPAKKRNQIYSELKETAPF